MMYILLCVLKLNNPQINRPNNNNPITFTPGEMIYKILPIIKPMQETTKGFLVDFLKRKVSYK